MSAPPAALVRRQPGPFVAGRGYPMSWDDYEHTGDTRGRYVDGVFWPMDAPRKSHQQAAYRLKQRLDTVLTPGHEVVLSWAWKPADDEWRPDVLVVPETDEDACFTGTPLLVAEVLSTNRADDLTRKSIKYAAAGLPRYWLLDPRDGTLQALELRDGGWDELALLEDADEAELDSGAGRVRLSPAALLD